MAGYHVPPLESYCEGYAVCWVRLGPSVAGKGLAASWFFPHVNLFAVPYTLLTTRWSLQGCQCLIAIERAKLEGGKPDPDSAYWN